MNNNEKEFLKWCGIALVAALIMYFLVKVIDAITQPSLVWFLIGILAVLVAEGIAWCVYRFRFKTWHFWRDTSTNNNNP